MCQGGERAPHCHGQLRDTQGCGPVWIPQNSFEVFEGSRSLLPNTRPLLCSGLVIQISHPPISCWRPSPAESMRHIQMETPPKEEAGVDTSQAVSSIATPSGQTGALDAGQDCRVLVSYPEKDLKHHKVYHVSVISEMPGPKACNRQALKRNSTDQLPPEPSRSPKRALWGQPRSDGPHGHLKSDGDYPSCSTAVDEDEQDCFEDGLLSDEMPLCGSAQHFSHSGLRVIEHRADGFSLRDLPCRRLMAQTIPSTRDLQTLSPTPCTSLHSSNLKVAQLENSEGQSVPHEGNGANIPMDFPGVERVAEKPASSRHILDTVLHNIAHTEISIDKATLVSSPSHSNGSLLTDMGADTTWTEPPTPLQQSPKLQEMEGLSSSEKTPPGLGRPCLSGTCTTVKRKLLPSSEATDSCSEDESPNKKWRAGQGCQALHGACRSTDSKAAPFWNHLLPASRNSQKSPAECTSRRLKRGLRLKSRPLRSLRKGSVSRNWATSCVSRSLLGNFEESILRGRFAPSGQIEGFTAEIGASGSYCPQHVTLPVEVTYFHISEHSVPSPFLGVIDLEAVGRKGYSVPSTGTIQVTLFNPNKTVVKMFLVTYDFKDMPPNHVTFLRHRIFLVPVQEEDGGDQMPGPSSGSETTSTTEKAKRILCYLMHLRFQRSKSGKIYLHDDIRLLFSRKSIEVDTGIPYELKSFTETPKNPKYSPRV
ncbi:atos homolog protein B isoform 1-T2 [Discoglossus pictus]